MKHPVAFCKKGRKMLERGSEQVGRTQIVISSASQDKEFGFKANFLNHTTLTKV